MGKKYKGQEEKYKILVITILCCICCCVTYYFHAILGSGIIFTHFFYIPIILSALWWQRKGLVVAIFLAGILIISSLFISTEVTTANDFLRALMFVIIAFIVAKLSKVIAKERVKIDHLNAILRALRNVNQLIVRENNSSRLIKGICEKLIETRGYYSVWIAVVDENQKFLYANEAGLGESFSPVIEMMKHGKFTPCAQMALKQSDIVIIEHNTVDCVNCLLAEAYAGKQGLAVRLELGGRVYGIMSVIIPAEMITDTEEQLLFHELANDIAFALRSIELEEKRTSAEQKIRELNRAIAQTSEGIATADLEGKFVFVNPTWAKMHGYQDADLIGKAVAILDSPDDQKKLPKVWETIQKKGFWSGELQRVRKDGSSFPAIMTSTLVKDDKDKPFGIIGTCLDISERKQAQEALRESEEKYRTLFGTAKDAIFLTDEMGRFVDVNQAACESLGYSREELLKLSNKEIDADPRGYEAFQKVRDGLVNEITFEVDQRRKDDTLLPVEVIGSFFVSAGQRVSLAIARDISERKRAEEEVRKYRDHLEELVEQRSTVLNKEIEVRKQAEKELTAANKTLKMLGQTVSSMNECVSITDTEHKIIFVNNAFVEFYGYSKEEIIGKTAKILQREIDPKLVNEIRKKTKLGGWKGELINQRKDGTYIPIELSVTPLQDKNGKVVAHIGISTDITERKQAEEAKRITEENFRKVIENIFRFVPEGLLVFTDKLNLFRENKAFKDIINKYASKLDYTKKKLTEIIIEQVKNKIINEDYAEIRIPQNRDRKTKNKQNNL